MNPRQVQEESAHPVTFIDLHEIDVYAQSGENECERDDERQGALETMYSLGLHGSEELHVDEMMRGRAVPSWPCISRGSVAAPSGA